MTEKPESEGADPRNKSCVSDTARDLATLHHICVSHLKELQVLSKTQVDFFSPLVFHITSRNS